MDEAPEIGNFDPTMGIRVFKHLVHTGVTEIDPSLDTLPPEGRAGTTPDAEREAIRQELLTPEVVEAILSFLWSFEPRSMSRQEAVCRLLRRQSPQQFEEIASRITTALRDGKEYGLGQLEYEASYGVEDVLKDLAELCAYTGRTGHDVYTFKTYMPLLLYAAVRDKRNYTGLRSFSLVLPVIDGPDSYSRAHTSFASLRKAIDHYQQTLAAGVENDIAEAYVMVDEARHEALKLEFDAEARRDIVTVTCLMTTVRGSPLRHFLPDDHFHLSLSMEHRRYLSAPQTSAFELMLDAVLLGIRELGADGSRPRTLLASCAYQPLVDFTVLSQYQRLQLEEPPPRGRTLGPRWESIKQEIKTLGGNVGGPLEHLGRCVLQRRNILAHPAKHPEDMAQTRGETLSDLCRLVDFIRFLDCSIPPTV